MKDAPRGPRGEDRNQLGFGGRRESPSLRGPISSDIPAVDRRAGETTREVYTDEQLIDARLSSWRGLTDISDPADTSGGNYRTTSFNDVYRQLDASRTDRLYPILHAHPLVDLGGGLSGMPNDILEKFGIQEYTNVDMQNREEPNVQPMTGHVKAELLSYVKLLPDKSANITSNGVLMDDWFLFAASPRIYNSPEQQKGAKLQEAYLSRILEEVHRVLPDDGVFMAHPFHFDSLAVEQGLVLDEELTTYTKPTDDSFSEPRRRLSVYRKAPTA